MAGFRGTYGPKVDSGFAQSFPELDTGPPKPTPIPPLHPPGLYALCPPRQSPLPRITNRDPNCSQDPAFPRPPCLRHTSPRARRLRGELRITFSGGRIWKPVFRVHSTPGPRGTVPAPPVTNVPIPGKPGVGQPPEPHLTPVFRSLRDPETPAQVQFVALHTDVPHTHSPTFVPSLGSQGEDVSPRHRRPPGRAQTRRGATVMSQTQNPVPSRPSKTRFLPSPVQAQTWLVLPRRTERRRGGPPSVRLARAPLSPRDRAGPALPDRGSHSPRGSAAARRGLRAGGSDARRRPSGGGKGAARQEGGRGRRAGGQRPEQAEVQRRARCGRASLPLLSKSPWICQACLPGSVFAPETGLDAADAGPPLLVISQVESHGQPGSCPSLPLRSPAAALGAGSRGKAVPGPPSAAFPTPHAPRPPRLPSAWPGPPRPSRSEPPGGRRLRAPAAGPKSACRDPCPNTGAPGCQEHLRHCISASSLHSAPDRMPANVSRVINHLCILYKFD